LNSDELAQNVLLLDIGAGISQGIVLQQGRPIYSTTVPLGGSLISSDIAQILKIPFEEAERVKKKYGAALPELADPDLALEVSSDSGAAGTLPASELARYIRPRVLEILGHCQQAFQPTLDEQRITLDQVVLTGGATLLKGSEELAQRLLGLPVRIGRPQGISGLTQEVSSPAHATVVGLVRYAAIKGAGAASESRVVEPVPVSWWGRIRNSFKNFF
jgi:cell division protein FtsA